MHNNKQDLAVALLFKDSSYSELIHYSRLNSYKTYLASMITLGAKPTT